MWSLSPMADCSVNDILVKMLSFFSQSFFKMINAVVGSGTIALSERINLMKPAINRMIDQLYFLAPYAFNSDDFSYNLYLF